MSKTDMWANRSSVVIGLMLFVISLITYHTDISDWRAIVAQLVAWFLITNGWLRIATEKSKEVPSELQSK